MNRDFFRKGFDPFWINYAPKLKKYGKQVLALLSVLIVAAVVSFLPLPPYFLVIISSVTLFSFSSKLETYDPWVDIICSGLSMAAAWVIVFAFDRGAYDFNYGCVIAAVLWCVAFYYMPTVLMRINPKLIKDESNNGSAFFYALFFATILFFYNNDINMQLKEQKFEQEPFVPVERWEIEVQDGNTCYILFTPKGFVVAKPQFYPEIRNINKNTKIKYWLSDYKIDGGGVYSFEKLVVKND